MTVTKKIFDLPIMYTILALTMLMLQSVFWILPSHKIIYYVAANLCRNYDRVYMYKLLPKKSWNQKSMHILDAVCTSATRHGKQYASWTGKPIAMQLRQQIVLFSIISIPHVSVFLTDMTHYKEWRICIKFCSKLKTNQFRSLLYSTRGVWKTFFCINDSPQMDRFCQ